MPIIGYSENANEVFYTVVGDDNIQEEISAKQLLASQPILVELYEYKNDVTIETRVERQIEKIEKFPHTIQRMFIDYFEVGQFDTGMQLAENIFGLGKKPPFSLLLSLVNMILQPKDEFKKKDKRKIHWQYCKRAHAILMDVLSLFGPEIFHPMWHEFKYFKLIPVQRAKAAKEADYSDMDTHELANYSDFWDYTEKLLNHGTTNLDSKCRTLILDFFINILQIDLKSRVDQDITAIKNSIFYKTINMANLRTYLKTLFKKFPNQDENLLYLSGDLLNMFITVSCFERTDMANQVYSKFQQMDAETIQQLMQVIKYPSFLLEVCDKALADTNVSKVEQRYRKYRNAQHIPLQLEKVLFYVFKTMPNSDSLESIYRHVSIVSKYCMCVFSTASISHKRASTKTNSAFSEEQLLLLITHQHQILEDWENMIEELIHKNDDDLDLDVVEKIRWAVKLTILTVTEYL